jgi:glutamyl-Q tRNA(Asp) synthetase
MPPAGDTRLTAKDESPRQGGLLRACHNLLWRCGLAATNAGAMTAVMTVTRFAPSPTGPLHLGHAYSAVVAHDAARAAGGAFRLRIDDIDNGRSRAEWRAAINDDLVWLGLDVDGPVVVQSERVALYAAARDQLRDTGVIYPCFCTRAVIAAEIAASAGAPHGPDGPLYPGTCRHRDRDEAGALVRAGAAAAWRLDMERARAQTGALRWWDDRAGEVAAAPECAGDVVLWRRDDGPAYHLASTIDDAQMGVTLAVRGADLFAATHVHRLLQALLDLPTPAYHHHRLIAGADGRRLAKRDAVAALAGLRHAGVDGRELAALLRQRQVPPGYGWVG